jgi:hypothetical protein
VPGLHELAIVASFAWFAMGWWPCRACMVEGDDCTYCSGATPLKFNLELAGVVDDRCATCDTEYNGTLFVLPQVTSIGACGSINVCDWFLHDTACNGHYVNTTMALHVSLDTGAGEDPGVTQLIIKRVTHPAFACPMATTGGITEGQLDARLYSGPPATLDCTATYSGGLQNTVSALLCDFDAATYELEYH